ncbi:biotin/lipoyl-containing protein [Corynebacterium mendelii]|uniref:Acetyl-CoA carboxylase biotin carboxyl carrier protein subunit n=1 Tax=Corynebacterium mendelii TaxID=2765362 RepID=A0A939E364_9CORY|nr:biotin/lipoyl-containing protein [Corynebacterium mendelii]MBN9644597.1 acetyl-CoA carboxylase biotin carboxyl carrier protein subunit [Corynebacterium mendelii]
MDICAPFAGIVHHKVAAGEPVDAGAVVATVETVKLEASVTAVSPGIVAEWLVDDCGDITGGDPIARFTPAAT